jgi:molybdenum cofactor cytidylyltransferase
MAILVLAAGSSTRMGQPKQLLRAGGRTLLQICLETALASHCSEVCCVLGAHATELRQHIQKYPVQLIENPHYQQGLSSSLRVGIAQLEKEEVEAAMVLLADMPNVSTAHLNELIDRFHEHPQQPAATAYANGLGVPAIFPATYFPKLKALKGDQGARALLNQDTQEISSLPFSDLTDIDTPEDFRAFLRKRQE